MEKDKLEAGQIWMWKPQDYNIATTFFDVVMVSEDGTFAGNFEYTNSDVFFFFFLNGGKMFRVVKF